MSTFLYYLPIFLFWGPILSNTILFILNGRKKNIVGMNVPKIKFLLHNIPAFLVFLGCYLTVDDFTAPYIYWILYAISLFIGYFVSSHIRKLQTKAVDAKVQEVMDNALPKLKKFIEENSDKTD